MHVSLPQEVHISLPQEVHIFHLKDGHTLAICYNINFQDFFSFRITSKRKDFSFKLENSFKLGIWTTSPLVWTMSRARQCRAVKRYLFSLVSINSELRRKVWIQRSVSFKRSTPITNEGQRGGSFGSGIYQDHHRRRTCCKMARNSDRNIKYGSRMGVSCLLTATKEHSDNKENKDMSLQEHWAWFKTIYMHDLH